MELPGGVGARAGERAPDAPCGDARLFDVFAGPHFTLLGFGAASRRALQAVAHQQITTLQTCLVHEPDVCSAYGAGDGGIVLVRPDGHIALTAGAAGPVLDYLTGLSRRPVAPAR